MSPYYGYQLYQAQRTRTRAEILAGDARLGRQAAAVFRGGAPGTAFNGEQDRSRKGG